MFWVDVGAAAFQTVVAYVALKAGEPGVAAFSLTLAGLFVLFTTIRLKMGRLL